MLLERETWIHSSSLQGRPLIDFMPTDDVTKAPSTKCASLKFLITAFLFISLPLI